MSYVLGGGWPEELWCGEGRTLRHQQGTGTEDSFLKGRCHKIRDSLLFCFYDWSLGDPATHLYYYPTLQKPTDCQ
jgi:hypothetical protein